MKQYSILSLLFFLIFSACSSNEMDNENCESTQTCDITVTQSPTEGTVNTPLDFTLEYTIFNGCGSFSQLTEDYDGTTVTIAIEANYVGCVCTEALQLGTVNYSVTPTIAGDYTFIFESQYKDDQVVNVTVTE